MRIIREHKLFKRDVKRITRSGADVIDDLAGIVAMLRDDQPLPERRRDHALAGRWAKIGARECHVRPDVLLVYAKSENELYLLRLGSHAELF